MTRCGCGTWQPPAVGATLTGHTGTVQSMAFNPDGRILVTGSNDKTAKLWRIR